MIAKLKTIKRSLGLGEGCVWSWLINKPLKSKMTVVRNSYTSLVLALQNLMNKKGAFPPVLIMNTVFFQYSSFIQVS